jgi:hypothetical protein
MLLSSISIFPARSPAQQKVLKQYYQGYIPHVVVLDAHGEPIYNRAGEVRSRVIESALQRALARLKTATAPATVSRVEHPTANSKSTSAKVP